MDKACRVLVVDDSPSDIALMVRALQREGFETICARDGTEALSLATRERPDVILLDMIMPGRSGLEVCKVLKARSDTASIPVIFVSAVTDGSEMLRAFDAGGADYVTKPFRVAELAARVSVHARLRRAEAMLIEENEQSEQLARELSQANVRLAHLSRSDPLTDLLNRRAWEEAAHSEHARFEHTTEPYSVLMVDVDYFKPFNDGNGHQAGDECLRRIAEAIATACRSVDLIGRYGGEEFVVLTPRTSCDGALKLAERVRQSVWALCVPHSTSSVSDRVTASVGVATVANSENWETVLQRADRALYVAKKAGRNMVYVDPESGPGLDMPPQDHLPQDLAKSRPPLQTSPVTILALEVPSADGCIQPGCLERHGYDLLRVHNLDEFFNRLNTKPPDVIILTTATPGLDVAACITQLKANPETCDIPVIITGAASDAPNVKAGIESGADEYVLTAAPANELVLRVRSMVRLRRERTDLLRSFEFRGEQTRILQCLLDFSRSAGASEHVDELLDHAMAATAEVTGSRRIAVFVPDVRQRALTITRAIGVDRDVIDNTRVGIGEMITGRSFALRRAIVVNTLDELVSRGQISDLGFFTRVPLVATPLGTRTQTHGVLAITGQFSDRPFAPHVLEYIDLIATITGTAMHSMASRQARDSARDSIMVAFAKLAEHRDSDTGRHVDRVTRYCLILAESLRSTPDYRNRIDETFLRDLERAVPLHDIGKVAIPDRILLKPGKLTPEEMEVMRSHARIGADTIQSVITRTPGASFLEMAADIARSHHEWWDGVGYPDKLRGDAIPLPARIAALADVYDALTTKRVYKDAIAHEEAVEIIADLGDKQFEPVVVRAFLEQHEEFRSLASTLVDTAPPEMVGAAVETV